jgi:hypothetical protein
LLYSFQRRELFARVGAHAAPDIANDGQQLLQAGTKQEKMLLVIIESWGQQL